MDRMEWKESFKVVQHSTDTVMDDIRLQDSQDMEGLLKKRNTAMNQEPWALDGQPNTLPDYEHGDPLTYEENASNDATEYLEDKGR